jgi:hypothetical protein
MIKYIKKHNPDIATQFIKYYMVNYNEKLHVNTFITLPLEYQLGIFMEFFQTMNLEFIFDTHTYIIYYIDPRLNANNVIAKYNKDGILTDELYEGKVEKDNNVLNSARLAIEYIINVVLIPF